MSDIKTLLGHAAAVASEFRETMGSRPVAPEVDLAALRETLGGPVPAGPADAQDVIDRLVQAVEPAIVATAGPRYFGFVIGGSLDAATAADILTTGWDQVGFNAVLSPAAAVVEEVAGEWLKELLGLPPTASTGFVTGGQAANTVGLASARHHVLAEAGWDVELRGLNGAPPLRVVAGAERHATIDRATRLLGLGTETIEPVQAGPNGAIDVADLRHVLISAPAGPTIVCLQAGNVNTGACDDLRGAIDVAHANGAWVHVDGAFGLWAAASPTTQHLVAGLERADSWACDGHKWLNVPYDSGFVFCSRPDVHAAAVSYTAAYLVGQGATGPRAPSDYALESSRRARGFTVWAALSELGRDGVAALVERCCALARRFAERLSDGGAEIVNDVVLNQVLVRFDDDDHTDRVIAAVQREGTCWMGGTTWRGAHLMRISVSNWTTTASDVDQSAAAILRLAHSV